MKTKSLTAEQKDLLVRYLQRNRSHSDAYLFFELMLRSGCRGDECIRIRECDIRRTDVRGEWSVTIFHGSKGSLARNCLLDDFTSSNLVSALFARARATRIAETTPLIKILSKGTNATALRLLRHHWYTVAEKVFGEKEGSQYSLHCLRHTLARLMYDTTEGDILAVQMTLGHISLTSTQHYLSHITADKFKKIAKGVI